MGQTAMRAASCVALTALMTGSLALSGPAAFGASAGGDAEVVEVVAPVPVASVTGTYIVLLDEEPAATYDGGQAGLAATAPAEGATLDTHSTRMKKYTAFLEKRQRDVAEQAGIDTLATYQVVLNGFSAEMEPDAAARVAAMDGVLAVYPDEIFRPTALPAGTGGAARSTTQAASDGGAGVVVGVIDTGIAPGNPSFAGDRLRTTRGPEPYLAGDTVVFDQADGRQFRSTRFTGDGWARADSSTKVVAAQFFAAGATAAGFEFSDDALSPQDRDGHGSRVAGVAAGNATVQVSVDGGDFGAISGVAPEAKIASYKACFAGGDALSTADDICVGSDVLAALDRAVADGVDVIAFALGAAPAPWGADDIAFYNAAAAGVFVSVSAGNGGPGPSTSQGGAPWYTTVAASTSAAFGATVSLSDGFAAPGVSVSVRPGETVSAPVVYAADAALDGSADAQLCYRGTLDPRRVAGKIVVCDRGTNPRSEKSLEVADAGGVGMILVNVSADSLDVEFDAVPTVHIDSAQRDDLLTAVRTRPAPTATLAAGGRTDAVVPASQIAGFSGRGPLSDGDVLTPDVAAPGVAVLAPTQDTPTGEPTWGIGSGTSLAAPHVAGLAARYLAATPAATPDEIKSALMTTATDTVNADGSADVDPFAQGAGQVDEDRLLDPGLLYLNGPAQWRGYLHKVGQGGGGDPSATSGELNLASISIGRLGQRHTVTRTLTAARAGTYEAAASIPGVDVTVSPATLTFAAPGDTQRFTVTFENDSAPVEQWATGYLAWTGEDGTSVRSPLSVRPVTVSATTLVMAQGIDGEAAVQLVSGATGELNVRAVGLAPVELLVDPDDPAPGHSGDAASGDANGDIAWIVPIAAGSPLAEFTLAASDASPLDLAVYRLTSTTDQQYDQRWASTAESGEERVTLVDPMPGRYLVAVDLREAAAGMTWDLTSVVIPATSRSLAVAPESVTAAAGDEVPLVLSWEGLRHDTHYLGVIEYADSAARTTVRIDAGSPRPVADAPPTVTGDAQLGEQLRVDPGSWAPEDVSFAYQWLRDGQPIAGAQAADYRVRAVDAGTALTAQVTARQPDNINVGTALSDPVVVNAGSTVTVMMNRSIGRPPDRYAVTVVVRTARGEPAEGTVSVSVDATDYVGTLADGEVTFTLPAQGRGIHVVVADYSGGPGVSASMGVSGFVVRD